MDFDNYSNSYDLELEKGLSLTGEDKDYFARQRANWMRELYTKKEFASPSWIMDFGCGDGAAISYLIEAFDAEKVVGVDVSQELINVGARTYAGNGRIGFEHLESYKPREQFDLVYTNGVFHHIEPAQRFDSVAYVYKALRRGGLFAFWENNPFNLGTRFIMSRVPFDRDAVMVYPSEAVRLLSEGGFKVDHKSFLFIFPSFLKWLRPLEARLSRFPLGGQYLVLAQKS